MYNDAFGDPADFQEASYERHPYLDILEPIDLENSAYKEASRRLLRVLNDVDLFIFSEPSNIKRQCYAVSIALGMASTRGKSLSAVADELGESKQVLSKAVTKFLRLTQLPPAWGLKTRAARVKYSQTNGRRFKIQ